MSDDQVDRWIIESMKRIAEDAPTNAVGGGNIAGAGVGKDGEPGRKAKRKKDSDDIVMALLKRKMPKT